MTEYASRRSFARIAAAVAVAGVGGCFHGADSPAPPANESGPGEQADNEDGVLTDDAADQANNESEPQDLSKWQDVEEIRLRAVSNGWIGISPDPIADTENPVLTLFEGREYTITIENEDGEQHDLVIEDAEGNVVDDYQSETVQKKGAEVSLEIEAIPEMVLYYCSYHEDEMSGEIRTKKDRDFSDPEDGVENGSTNNSTRGGDNNVTDGGTE